MHAEVEREPFLLHSHNLTKSNARLPLGACSGENRSCKQANQLLPMKLDHVCVHAKFNTKPRTGECVRVCMHACTQVEREPSLHVMNITSAQKDMARALSFWSCHAFIHDPGTCAVHACAFCVHTCTTLVHSSMNACAVSPTLSCSVKDAGHCLPLQADGYRLSSVVPFPSIITKHTHKFIYQQRAWSPTSSPRGRTCWRRRSARSGRPPSGESLGSLSITL